jgi:hypothetical protein
MKSENINYENLYKDLMDEFSAILDSSINGKYKNELQILSPKDKAANSNVIYNSEKMDKKTNHKNAF